jgi:glycosyltransferase involved in cell wall biosynthesis
VENVSIARSYDLARHARTIKALRTLFRRERFDAVHVHTPVAAMVGRYAAWRAGVPKIVYTAHGFYFHEHMPLPLRAAHVGLEFLSGRMTDMLFTQAEEDAETARRLKLCRTGRIHAIGNGVDTARFKPADSAARARLRAQLRTPDSAVVIAMIGRLVAEKGYPELFEAMRGNDAILWVVGDRLKSDHASGISATIDTVKRDMSLGPRIRFLGYRQDVPDILAASDIFTLPSHREGMPRSIIEAMMTGLPVVATDIRGAREEVVEGETGFLVPVRDSAALAAGLARLTADPALRARMGAAGRVRSLDLYDEAKVVRRQLELIGSL